MTREHKSVYTLGAEDGLVMGPLMALTVFLIGASTYFSWLYIPALIAILAVPVFAYYLLAKGYVSGPNNQTFTFIWLRGICMFFFGGLIMAVVAFILLRWSVPGFVNHQIDMIISVYGSMDSPAAASMVDSFKRIKEAHILPSALDIALELLYLSVFSGSILSLCYAFFIRRRKPMPPSYNG